LGPTNHILDGGTYDSHLANTIEQSMLGFPGKEAVKQMHAC